MPKSPEQAMVDMVGGKYGLAHSPAVGEWAVQELAKVRAQNVRLRKVLDSLIRAAIEMSDDYAICHHGTFGSHTIENAMIRAYVDAQFILAEPPL